MLEKHSAEVTEALEHASQCEVLAEKAIDPVAKTSFFDLAKRWRRIAATLQHIERTDQFLSKSKG